MDLSNMMGKVRDMQAKLKEAQEKLDDLIVEGEAGAGMVRAEVNGKKKLLKLHIDEDVLKPEDREMMTDLIVAAVNNAMDKAEAAAKEEIQKSTDGIMPNIPGFNFGGA